MKELFEIYKQNRKYNVAPIERYSRVAPEKKAANIEAAIRKSMLAALWAVKPLDQPQRPGIDVGRRPPSEANSQWGGWLDTGDSAYHSGWQIYCIAMRDLIFRGFTLSEARTVASQLTCWGTVLFVPYKAAGGLRAPELGTCLGPDRGCDRLGHISAWTNWALKMRSSVFDPKVHASRRVRRTLEANKAIRAKLSEGRVRPEVQEGE